MSVPETLQLAIVFRFACIAVSRRIGYVPRAGQMVLRWTAAAILEAVKGFRRLKGHKDMPKLVAGLRARDQQLGLEVSAENVA